MVSQTIVNVPVEVNVAPVVVAHERSADHQVTVTVPSMVLVATEVGVVLVIPIVYVLVVVPSSAVTVELSVPVLPAVDRFIEVVHVIVAYALLTTGVEVIVPIYEYNICNV